eukprot:jgi/Chrzof1/12858/Cz07g09260.t1
MVADASGSDIDIPSITSGCDVMQVDGASMEQELEQLFDVLKLGTPKKSQVGMDPGPSTPPKHHEHEMECQGSEGCIKLKLFTAPSTSTGSIRCNIETRNPWLGAYESWGMP